jgi:hypothetical protein
LESVHMNTVTSNRQMPSVLLATTPNPSLDLHPLATGDEDLVRSDEPIEAAISAASSENRRSWPALAWPWGSTADVVVIVSVCGGE